MEVYNYIVTNGEVKSRTGSTAAGNASYGCTNNRAITYGAFPRGCSTGKGNYCTKYQDAIICTSSTGTNCTVTLGATPHVDGLYVDASVTCDVAYTANRLIVKKAIDDYVIYDGSNGFYSHSWLPNEYEDFKVEATAVAATNVILYTSTTGTVVTPASGASWGGRSIVSNTYSNGRGVIVFNNSLTTIGANSFKNCTTLKTITLPSTMGTIGIGVFSGCTSLTDFTVPPYVTAINASTFAGCTSLTSCTMHNNITTLGDYVFEGCSSLTSPTSLPTSLTSIGKQCFAYCSALTSMYIPNSVTTLKDKAFYDCSGLKTFSFGPTITNFSTSALEFNHNSYATVTWQMGAATFRGTIAQLRAMHGGSTTSQGLYSISAYGVICTDGLYTDHHNCIVYRTSNSAVLAPYNAGAFYNDTTGICSILQNMYFSDTNVGVIKFNNQVDRLTGNAFLNKTGYTMMAFSPRVKAFDSSDFQGCTGLTHITFGFDNPLASSTSSRFTSIGANCFKNCSSLTHFNFYGYISLWTEVTLGSSWSSGLGAEIVKCLDGDYPLTGADRITYTATQQITFNESAFNTTVKSHSFLNNQGTIIFNDDVTTIGANAFNANTYSSCSHIVSMTLPLTVTSIGNYAFINCNNLGNINLKQLTNLQTIGNYAFASCTSLWNSAVSAAMRTQNAGIANSVISIGNWAFTDCTGMVTFQIHSTNSNLTTIGQYAFQSCSSLTSIILPNSLTTLSMGALYLCSSLTSLTVRSGVTILNSDVFRGCTSLTTLVIPTSVTTFSATSLSNTTSLKYINYLGTVTQFHNITKNTNWNSNGALVMAFTSADEDWYLIDDSKIIYRTSNSSVLAPNDTTAFSHTYNSNTYDTTATRNIGIMSFSGNLTSIGTNAFYNKAGYTKMLIPKTVLSIGQNAFNMCAGLTSLSFHTYTFQSLTTIYDYAFASCTGITSLSFGNNVTTINSNAFRYCSGATSISIGTGMTSLTDNPFAGCSAVTSIAVASGNTTYNSNNSCKAIIKTSGNILVAGCMNTTIPSTVTTIGTSAFEHILTSTSGITIPSGVTTINNSAFYGCTGLTNITLPNTVTTLSDNAFNGCTSLIAFTLSSRLTSIGINVFTNTAIEAFIFTSTRSAFDGISKGTTWFGQSGYLVMCSDKWRLLHTNIIAYKTSNNAVLAPYSTTVFGGTYNSNTYNTTTYSNNTYHYGLIKFSGNVTQCGANAFYTKTGYTQIYLPSTAVTIGNQAFSGCTGLTTLDYGSISGTIGNSAFYGCTGLTSIPIPSGVTSLGTYALYNTHITSLSLPNTVTSIGTNLCQSCTYLTSATLGTGITSLSANAFQSCSAMTTLTMNGVVTTYDTQACAGCTSLSTITTGSTIMQYVNATRASNWHTSVPATTVTCSNGTTPIDPTIYCVNYESSNSQIITLKQTAFNQTIISNSYEHDLGSWIFAAAPTTILQNAFNNCGTLTKLIIPTSITSIGSQAFYNSALMAQLVPIYFTDTFSHYCGISYDALYNYGIRPVVKCSDNVEYIMGNAFYYITNDGNAPTPSVDEPFGGSSIASTGYFTAFGVTYTENDIVEVVVEAFKNNNKLTTIYFPSTVEYIGNAAFYANTNLTTVYLPYNLAIIRSYAFANCTALANMYYPKTMSEFNNLIFDSNWHDNCPNLMYVHCSDGDVCLGTEITYTSSNGRIVTGYVANPFNQTMTSNTYTSGTGHMLFTTAPTAVNDNAFLYAYTLTSMTLCNGITSIGKQAFTQTGLTSIVLPSTLTTIDQYAFYNTRLISLTIPANVSSITAPIVSNVSTLTTLSVNSSNTTYDSRNSCNAIIKTSTNTMIQGCKNSTFPSTVTTIGSLAFDQSYITNVNIPNTVTTIQNQAFYRSSRLTNVSIGSGVSSLGTQIFSWCGQLAYISVDSGNTTYDSRNNCNAIIDTGHGILVYGCINTVIPTDSDLTSIGDYAFEGTGITTINIPDNITSIGTYVFNACSSLTTVTFNSPTPPSMTDAAFGDCTSLTTIYVPAGSLYAYQEALPKHSSIIQEMTAMPKMCYSTNNSQPATPSNPQAFGAEIVSNVYDEKQECCVMTFNSSVTGIGENAFYGCSTLTGIEIPETVTSIGPEAFYGTSLNSLNVPGNVTSIGSGAFKDSALSEITLTDNIEEIQSAAFMNTKLQSFTMPNNSALDKITTECFSGCSLESITIGNNITSIGESAFYQSNLQSISLPSTLIDIQQYAFKETPITSITIPGSVTAMGVGAFLFCSSLEQINFASGTDSLFTGEQLFQECTALKSITLPSRLSDQSGFFGMFADCTNLINVNFCLNDENSYKIGDSMFKNCRKLKQITLPDNITSIEGGAFSDCIDLQSINLPGGISIVETKAFAGCKNLKFVVSESTGSFPTISDDAFENTSEYIRMVTGMKKVSCPIRCITPEIYAARSCYQAEKMINFKSVFGCEKYTQTMLDEHNFLIDIYDSGMTIKDVDIRDFLGTTLYDILLPDYDYGFVEQISFDAFAESTIEYMILPNNVTSINDGCFRDCRSLGYLIIGTNVNYIGNCAIGGCTALSDIYYKGTMSEWNNILKEDLWATNNKGVYCLANVVHCIDGDVAIPKDK